LKITFQLKFFIARFTDKRPLGLCYRGRTTTIVKKNYVKFRGKK
jgi:hypothetical protein